MPISVRVTPASTRNERVRTLDGNIRVETARAVAARRLEEVSEVGRALTRRTVVQPTGAAGFDEAVLNEDSMFSLRADAKAKASARRRDHPSGDRDEQGSQRRRRPNP
jgi:hypothetical protein